MAGYVNTVRAIVCSELPAREARNFCDIWKLTSCDFILISSLIELNFCFLHMCLLRINLPNMCPNMNHFDAVDSSECHSEEVMFLLTLSLERIDNSSLVWRYEQFIFSDCFSSQKNKINAHYALALKDESTIQFSFSVINSGFQCSIRNDPRHPKQVCPMYFFVWFYFF